MSIIKANEVLQYLYGPPPKGRFDNKEVNELVGKPCERVPLKEAVKAPAVAAEAAAQVEDDMTDKEEEKLDKQYAAIKIDYENKVIGEV